MKEEATLAAIAKVGFEDLGRGAILAEYDDRSGQLAGDEADAPQMNEITAEVSLSSDGAKVQLTGYLKATGPNKL